MYLDKSVLIFYNSFLAATRENQELVNEPLRRPNHSKDKQIKAICADPNSNYERINQLFRNFVSAVRHQYRNKDVQLSWSEATLGGTIGSPTAI